MKHILVLVIAFSASISLYAQAPSLEWVAGIGGTDHQIGHSIAVDADGNVYSAGTFTGTTDFDPGAGTYNLTAPGIYASMFISKLDSNGNFAWAKSISANGGFAPSLALDANGDVYLTGYFFGTVDFDPGPGTYNLTAAISTLTVPDIFVSKLNANGNFIWAKRIGGNSADEGNAITVDYNQNIYVTGYFIGTVDFDPDTGTYNLTNIGYATVFICKLDSAGNFIWAKCMPGQSITEGNSVTVDANGNVLTTGYFYGAADFDPGPGVYMLDSGFGGNIFISKLDSAGNFAWAKSMGASGYDHGKSINADAFGNVYTTGFFDGTVDFDPGPGTYYLSAPGAYYIFISKLDYNGNFIWAKNFSGITGNYYSTCMTLDDDGNCYSTGNFLGTADFDPDTTTYNLTPAGDHDIFMSKLDSGGNFVWAKKMGGTGNDRGNAIALDVVRNVYVTGAFSDTADFEPPTAAILISDGNNDCFVAKYGMNGVGIAENNLFDSFKLFPNPANGNFTIELYRQFEAAAVRVFNVTGQEVFNNLYHRTNTLNVSFEGGAGIYFVEVRSDNGEMRRAKILKE